MKVGFIASLFYQFMPGVPIKLAPESLCIYNTRLYVLPKKPRKDIAQAPGSGQC